MDVVLLLIKIVVKTRVRCRIPSSNALQVGPMAGAVAAAVDPIGETKRWGI